MATIVTRAGKGSALSHTEGDANFTNLNTDKAELSGATFTGAVVTSNTLTANGAVDLTSTFSLGGVAVTSTSAELNLLDGVSLASSDDVIDNFPSGTLMLFQQTTAPTGWTKQVTHNNKALRVVSGTASSGGSSSFSTVFGKTATDSHTLTTAQSPAHTHGSAGAHTHDVQIYDGNTNGTTEIRGSSTTGSPVSTSANALSAGAHTHGSSGGGGGHSHNMDIRVQYVDLIIASKD